MEIHGKVNGVQLDALVDHFGTALAPTPHLPFSFRTITHIPDTGPTTRIMVFVDELGQVDMVKLFSALNTIPVEADVNLGWSPRAPNVVELSAARKLAG